MSRRLVWSLLFGVAVSLAALIASRDQDAITSLLRHDLGSLALKIILLVFLGGLILTLFRERLSSLRGQLGVFFPKIPSDLDSYRKTESSHAISVQRSAPRMAC